MKLIVAPFVAVFGVVLACGYAVSQSELGLLQSQAAIPGHANANPFGPPALPTIIERSVVVRLPEPAFKVQGWGTRTNSSQNLYFFRPPTRHASPPRPPPGVYEAAPFTCIVVVPGAHPDDRCVVGAPNVDPNMPMAKPELRLIPRSRK